MFLYKNGIFTMPLSVILWRVWTPAKLLQCNVSGSKSTVHSLFPVALVGGDTGTYVPTGQV